MLLTLLVKPRPLFRTLAKVHKNYRVKIIAEKNFILIAGFFFQLELEMQLPSG